MTSIARNSAANAFGSSPATHRFRISDNLRRNFLSLIDEPFTIELPPANGTDSFFVLAPHKAGSVLLFSLVRDLAAVAGRSVVDLPGQAFVQGVSTGDLPSMYGHSWRRPATSSPGIGDLGSSASCALTARAERSSLFAIHATSRCLIIFPFETAIQFQRPVERRTNLMNCRAVSSRLSIEAFLKERRADGIFENMRRFAAQIGYIPNFRVFRYEDVIFEKVNFVTALAAELQLDVSLAKNHRNREPP
jgi:hypothetical protein